MSVRSLRHVRSIPSLRAGLHSSASATKPSHLLTTQIQSRYNALTVNALKSECRQRGLKLVGRKADLVDRLVTFESTKTFSTASAKQAKGDGSHIDYYEVPKAPQLKGPPKPPFKVPAPPDASHTTPEIDANYNDVTTAAPDVNNAPIGVHVVSGQSDVAAMDAESGSVTDTPQHTSEIPSRDKPFLLALAATIAAWWGSQFVGSSKKSQK